MRLPANASAYLAHRPLCLLPEAALALADGGGAQVERKPYPVVSGVAIVSVIGSLGNRADSGWIFDDTYERLRSVLGAAAADPTARAIVLDMDSPGGEAAGAMELSAYVRAVSARKPVVAYADGMAASAAYAIASGASEIVTAPSATLGSIGVVSLHMDVSGALDARGLKPTLLHAGAYKVDGSSLKSLDPGARSRIEAMLGNIYSLFTSTVGVHRPALGVDGARRTEAGVFVGQQAVNAKLADRVGSLGDAIASARSIAAARTAPITLTTAAKPATTSKGNQMPTEPELSDFERGRQRFAAALGKSAAPVAQAPRFGLDAEPDPFLSAKPFSAERRAQVEDGRKRFAAVFGKAIA